METILKCGKCGESHKESDLLHVTQYGPLGEEGYCDDCFDEALKEFEEHQKAEKEKEEVQIDPNEAKAKCWSCGRKYHLSQLKEREHFGVKGPGVYCSSCGKEVKRRHDELNKTAEVENTSTYVYLLRNKEDEYIFGIYENVEKAEKAIHDFVENRIKQLKETITDAEEWYWEKHRETLADELYYEKKEVK